MELLKANFLQTTTQMVVGSNTATAAYAIERDTRYQYITSGFADDSLPASITINFSETTTVSRIALLGMNLKDFRAYYNGLTANVFALTSTSDTTTLNYISNSNTSKYWAVTPVDCTSVTFQLNKTIVANQEKAIGFIAISDVLSDFDKIPSAQGFTPLIVPEQFIHDISDGGKRMHTIHKKFQCRINMDNITESFRDELKSVYDTFNDLMFCAFGTTTGWDENLYPVIWPGNFDFYKFSDNAIQAGFSGNITLLEATR